MRTPKPLSFLIAAAFLAGCGGHGGASASSSRARTGKIAFTVAWPIHGRYVPTAASVIEIKVFAPGANVATATPLVTRDIVYPATTSPGDALNEGTDYPIVAKAYYSTTTSPETTDPNKNPLASGMAKATIAAGQTTNQTVTMSAELQKFTATVSDPFRNSVAYGDGSYTLTPGGTVTNVPALAATSIVQILVTPKNAASGTLTLYPTLGTVSTTTLSTSGGLTPLFGLKSATALPTTTLNSVLVPTSIVADSGVANIVFTDGTAPVFNVSLPFTIASLSLSGTTDLTLVDPLTGVTRSTTEVDSVAAAPDAQYAFIHVSNTDTTTMVTTDSVELRKRTSGVTTTLAPFPVTATADPSLTYVVGAATGHYLYGTVGGTSVTDDQGDTNTFSGSLAGYTLQAITAYKDKIYVAASNGTVTGVYLADIGTGTLSLGEVGKISTGSVDSFALGYDAVANGPTAFTVEGTTVKRYEGLDAGGTSALVATFPTVAITNATAIAIYGNVVFVATASGLKTLNLAGAVTGTLANPSTANPTQIGVAEGKGIVSTGRGTNVVTAFNFS